MEFFDFKCQQIYFISGYYSVSDLLYNFAVLTSIIPSALYCYHTFVEVVMVLIRITYNITPSFTE